VGCSQTGRSYWAIASKIGQGRRNIVEPERGHEAGKPVGPPGDEIRHRVVGEPGERRRLVGPGHAFEGRHREREDLPVVGPKLLHHQEPRLQVVEHGDREPALDRPLVRGDLHQPVEVSPGEDVGVGVDFHGRPSLYPNGRRFLATLGRRIAQHDSLSCADFAGCRACSGRWIRYNKWGGS
jgi:hypothetical protein